MTQMYFYFYSSNQNLHHPPSSNTCLVFQNISIIAIIEVKKIYWLLFSSVDEWLTLKLLLQILINTYYKLKMFSLSNVSFLYFLPVRTDKELAPIISSGLLFMFVDKDLQKQATQQFQCVFNVFRVSHVDIYFVSVF